MPIYIVEYLLDQVEHRGEIDQGQFGQDAVELLLDTKLVDHRLLTRLSVILDLVLGEVGVGWRRQF